MIGFDLDGTLVDSRLDLFRAVNMVRAQFSQMPLNYESSWADLCKGMPHLFETCFGEDVFERSDVQSRFERIYEENIFQETRVYPGIVDLLSRLVDIDVLAVVTNKPQGPTTRLLESADLLKFFEVVVGGDRLAVSKPNPEPLLFAWETVGKRGPLMMVGDSHGDMVCAQRAGAYGMWCRWGYWDTPSETASIVVDGPDQIPSIIKEFMITYPS